MNPIKFGLSSVNDLPMILILQKTEDLQLAYNAVGSLVVNIELESKRCILKYCTGLPHHFAYGHRIMTYGNLLTKNLGSA